jgi:hypothetical protein
MCVTLTAFHVLRRKLRGVDALRKEPEPFFKVDRLAAAV